MVRQLTKEEFLAIKNRANAAITYDKTAFIGNGHKEDYVDAYETDGFVFIQKASTPKYNPSNRYDDWTPELHMDDVGYEKIRHGRRYFR